jgi:hypothetical protein
MTYVAEVECHHRTLEMLKQLSDADLEPAHVSPS